jgi:ethanolamine transporter EutH
MSNKGMIFNAAFEVGAAYALGDHLAYLGSVERGMIVPLILGKLFAAALSVVLCIFTADFFVRKALESRGDKLAPVDVGSSVTGGTENDSQSLNEELLPLADL